MNRSHALMLLSECTGDDIWSVEYCRKCKIPGNWIDELRDAYESGFNSTDQTIFHRNEIVNQYEGIRDVDLACKIGQVFGVDVARIVRNQFARASVVIAIREAIEEG